MPRTIVACQCTLVPRDGTTPCDWSGSATIALSKLRIDKEIACVLLRVASGGSRTLAIAFACNIGGMTSPVASPQSVVAFALLHTNYGLSFSEWCAIIWLRLKKFDKVRCSVVYYLPQTQTI
ncbi:hypothetical protein Pmar_PMAR009888 [Perkinsus marinus ATCC 50983]|uniref:Uncharacterized protein n=1 Tax=Perkinsus marinus (strain ATCC 50983 / TXsc) TaxID=423536 RepID=C5KIA8_PERM5|nr:hypothetical protein Pmar_PMAR009888 [Perkinsus marinus ATCC 50983]EER15771.1 hypothetical protein Pmar_PMAR009888 [Perkinsus marinus ATCC 50983]|eukprot:XP_002783975.1 hypothetical protein Pmar_PMAR009888 [Perkinsus marinus ATCC 50983]